MGKWLREDLELMSEIVDISSSFCCNALLFESFPPSSMSTPRTVLALRLGRTFGLSALTALAVILLAGSAHAADGTLTIVQKSPVSDFGDWQLVTPGGSTVQSFQQEESRFLGSSAEGKYSFSVTSPKGASATISLMEGATVLKSTKSNAMEFDLAAGQSLTISVEYSYAGTVRVLSTPSDAPFELTAGSMRYTGKTPATFDDLPPLQYSVHFGMIDGCGAPKPYKRSLAANGTLTFNGEYICGTASKSSSSAKSSKTSSSSLSSSSSSSEVRTAAASLSQSVQQREVLPGGTVQFTVGVRNISKSTLKNLTVTEQFDAAHLTIVEPLEWSGRVEGNLIIWNVPQIFAGQSWSAPFKATVKKDVPAGTQITLTARVSGEDLNNATLGNLSSTTTVGVTTLPKTGIGFDILFLVLSGLLAAGTTRTLRVR